MKQDRICRHLSNQEFEDLPENAQAEILALRRRALSAEKAANKQPATPGFNYGVLGEQAGIDSNVIEARLNNGRVILSITAAGDGLEIRPYADDFRHNGVIVPSSGRFVVRFGDVYGGNGGNNGQQ